MRCARLLAPLCLALTTSISALPAYAQTADVSRFRTPMTSRGGIAIEGASTLLPLDFSLGLTFHYAANPVVWRYPFDAYEPVLEEQWFIDPAFVFGVLPGFDVGLVLPIVVSQDGPVGAGLGDLAGAGVGDLRVMPRVQLTDDNVLGFDSVLIAELTFPTGDDRRFIGDPKVSFRPRLVTAIPFSILRFRGELAYRMRANRLVRPLGVTDRVAELQGVDLGDELEFGVGLEARVAEGAVPVSLYAELTGATSFTKPFQAEGLFGMELTGGGRVRLARTMDVTLGAAAGLSQGIGTPMYRVIVGVAFAEDDKDTDRDGLPDRIDACPAEPEDYDGFQDEDGCPEPDNDHDGILDAKDRCPLDPETVNGIADKDGCPDGADLDKDGDGIQDDKDQCPLEPEDIDGYQDADGCPDPDNDRDGIVDESDECPEERETINGRDDYDGCPDEGEGATEYIERDRIVINETVNFETGKSTIKDNSKPLLDQVALQILAHEEIKKVRVEGHTDADGGEEDNLILSQDRADAVRRYLVSRGVPPERLESIGYGESRPIESNATAAGKARNRRVEFVILDAR